MAYSDRFVLSVLVNNTPQKEINNIIAIKFGEEYGLRFRNKHDRRAVVKFTIDGEDVSGNGGYVIPAKSFIDIFRHFDKDAKFKFVSLDSPEAVDYGKNDNLDGNKGVIEARFYLEKLYSEYYDYIKTPIPWIPEEHPRPYTPYPYPYYPVWRNSGPQYTYDSGSTTIGCMRQVTANSGNVNTTPINETYSYNPLIQEGCTVPSGASGQKFESTYIDLEYTCTIIKCTLKGICQTEAKIDFDYCTTCGTKKVKKSHKFCGVCGTRF